MKIYMKDGRVFQIIKPCAFGGRPTFSYANGLLSFLAKGHNTTVTVLMNEIALVG